MGISQPLIITVVGGTKRNMRKEKKGRENTKRKKETCSMHIQERQVLTKKKGRENTKRKKVHAACNHAKNYFFRIFQGSRLDLKIVYCGNNFCECCRHIFEDSGPSNPENLIILRKLFFFVKKRQK